MAEPAIVFIGFMGAGKTTALEAAREAGLETTEIDQLMDFIRWIRREFQLTILLIEHQMKLVMGICERIKVLDFGRTLAEGPPEVVRSDPSVLEAYLGEKVAR